MRFRTMRRVDRDLGADAAIGIIRDGHSGVLCVDGAEGYPYGVPMNYCFDGERILFHCSKHPGLLLESIGDGCRACFTVVEHLEGVRSRSAIAFGTVSEDPDSLRRCLEGVIDKYVPEPGRAGAKDGIPGAAGRATALVFTIEHVSAKVIDRPEGR